MSSSRRKSKLILLNNECVNEMPIVVLNEISSNSTENKMKTPTKRNKNPLKDQKTTVKNSDFDTDMYTLIKQKNHSKTNESPIDKKFPNLSSCSASRETNAKESKSRQSKDLDDSNILKENILLSPSKRKTTESDFDANLRTPTKRGKSIRNEEVTEESPVHRKFNRLSLQPKCDTSRTSIEDTSNKNLKLSVKKKLENGYNEITPEKRNSNIVQNELSPSKCSPVKEMQNTDLLEKSECEMNNQVKKITKCDNSDLKESENSAEENDLVPINMRSLKKINKTNSSQKNTPSENIRRSTRLKRMSIKAMEAKGVSPCTETEQSLMSSDDSSEECEQDTNVKEKPSTLFEDKDVAGRLLFGFQTPKKRDGLTKKAIESTGSPRTPKSSKITKKVIEASQTPKTPIGKLIVPLKNLRTPQAIRSQIKKKLNKASQKAMHESDSEFSDYSAESDYKPSDLSSSSDEESDSSKSESDSDSDTQRTTRYPDRKIQIKKNVTNTKLIQSSYKLRQRRDLTYTLKFEDYFASHGGSKSLTSNHTLQRLKNPKLQQDRLNKLLSSMVISKQHENSINTLFKEHKSIFDKWLCILHEGFSILLYGLGSKYSVIQSFHKEYLSNSPVIVVNGFFPSLLVKDILDGIIDDLLELPDNPTNVFDAVDLIDKEFSEIPELHLFLLIHNIDGDMLRNNKCQNVLSRLAKIPNIHLVASVDHINAPLIWDHKKLSRFNFTWWDATTFLPYKDETSFESSLLVQQSGALTLSSLRNVFRSLTTNARGIYNIIMKNQLENKGNQHYQGMQFKDLYRACREAFLVSSDLALRAQLTEFLDHKLVKSRRNIDGAELLNIPIENNLLKHFMDE